MGIGGVVVYLRNDEAAKPDRLLGAKQMAVKVILDMPPAARNAILKTVSAYGWEGASSYFWTFWPFIYHPYFTCFGVEL